MTDNVQGVFASEKINKVRWKHEDFDNSKYFVTGSWDDPVNKIGYWMFQKNEEEELVPKNIASSPVLGDVTEIIFIDRDQFVYSSSDGSVRVMKLIDEPYPDIKEQINWVKIHRFNNELAPCTALATFERNIVTVGEDGRINLLDTQSKVPARTIDNADSCSLCCVDFLRHSEILTGNSRGHMKVWDLRNNQDKPTTSVMLSDQSKTEATCIAHHPTQKHIVVAGGGDGGLTVWDLRYKTYPIGQLSAHTKSISEVLFHPDRPDNIYSCSISGELWHWNNTHNSKLKIDNTDTHWLCTIGSKGKLQVNSLYSLHMPINSIDIDKSTLLFGCDNEGIYVIKNLTVL